MATSSAEEFKLVLQNLVERTRSGSIEWSRVNPTTYSWANNKGRAIIQQVEQKRLVSQGGRVSSRSITSYTFQTYDSAGVLVLKLGSGEMAELGADLETLFKAASESVLSQGLGVLKNMLD
jgi:hypothetical protein